MNRLEKRERGRRRRIGIDAIIMTMRRPAWRSFFSLFLVFFGLDRWTGRDFATMDGEEDEMTRDEMRYLLRGGVVLYYFPFFLGKGERVLSCQYLHQEDSN